MVLRLEHLMELRRVLDMPTKSMPWVVRPEDIRELEELGICTDGFIAAAPLIPFPDNSNNNHHSNKNNHHDNNSSV